MSRSITTCRSARPIRLASTSWCTCPRARSPDVSYAELEREVLAAARTWDDALSDALVIRYGEVQGHALARRYAGLFPEYYKSAAPIFMAEFDVDAVRAARPRAGPTPWRCRTRMARPSR